MALKDTAVKAEMEAGVLELQSHGMSVYALASGTEGPQHLNFLGLVGLRFTPQPGEPMDCSHHKASRPDSVAQTSVATCNIFGKGEEYEEACCLNSNTNGVPTNLLGQVFKTLGGGGFHYPNLTVEI